MAKNEEKVMEFVKKELSKNPNIKTSDLYEKAQGVDSGVKKLSLRQFNARFPLQVKRVKSLKKGKRGSRRTKTTRRGRSRTQGGREGVREVFLRFAADLTEAEEKKDLVRVLAGVDRYVDDAVKAAGK